MDGHYYVEQLGRDLRPLQREKGIEKDTAGGFAGATARCIHSPQLQTLESTPDAPPEEVRAKLQELGVGPPTTQPKPRLSNLLRDLSPTATD